GEPRTQLFDEATDRSDPFFPPLAPFLVVPLLGLFRKELSKGHELHPPSPFRSVGEVGGQRVTSARLLPHGMFLTSTALFQPPLPEPDGHTFEASGSPVDGGL